MKKISSGSIFPQVIGLVVTKDTKINICPVTWQVVSTKYESPMSVCVGLSSHHYSLQVVRKTSQFVFCYPSKEQLRDVLYCGTVSGNDVDKIRNTRLTFDQSKKISTPILNKAVVNYECEFVEEVQMGNYSIVVGLVKKIHESEGDFLEKIYAFGGQRYGVIEELRVLEEGRS